MVGLGWVILLMSMLMVFFAGAFLGTVIRDKSSKLISLVVVAETGGFGILRFFAKGETKGEALVLFVLVAGKAAGGTPGVGLVFDAFGLDMVGTGCRSL